MTSSSGEARSWRMFAGRSEEVWANQPGWLLFAHPTELYVKGHGATPVPVVATENEDGPYWGWVDAPDQQHGPFPDYPSMVWHRRDAFNICFAYGPDAEEAAGKGRIVRLSIEESDD